MNQQPDRRDSYSATVTLSLEIGGSVFPLVSVSDCELVLAVASPVPSGPAVVVTTVDDRVTRYAVQVHAEPVASRMVRISLLGAEHAAAA